ncbi:MAG TPA: nitroreductase family deazaflavin-dependent oxidoreductase [Candidatus Xenobia bacterium]|jgi:deazaflavin-dependent oxidoreductase (nitroreductase family)
MHLPNWLRYVNRVVTNPILGMIAWLVPPFAVVKHRGRKSGKQYRTPVIGFGSRRGFVIPMTYRRDTDWARNVLAAGTVDIVHGGQTFTLGQPRVVGWEEAEGRLPFVWRQLLGVGNLPGYLLLDP